ncbi:sulfatase family protein [Flammeovirga agarivorans]|uniref:Sulfatase-like hydrolase/transferase n=1 Tax=Flammeovirga agarivorans TaxID=2726742 RepID=A0A7X8XYE0_9BACT|nr:sulfatase-like hydrolase/transferase [Flammeovirga agarivorans]NLR93950.1 sulfatase-like hydrolase/transferase [Flammeovirga agarivorans]
MSITFRSVLFVSAMFLYSCSSTMNKKVEEKRPNIVFILTDDQHRDQYNFLPEGRNEDGSLKNLSPNIDKLANEGVILRGLHCPSPICVPSRFNYLTGRYASRATNGWMQDLHRIHKHTFVAQEPEILPDTPTFARQLKDLGYVTGFYGKNHSIEQRDWKKLPVDADVTTPESSKYLKEQHDMVRNAIKESGFDYADRVYHTNPRAHGPRAISVHNLEWVTEGALDFIDQNSDKPFYLYYATTVPHGPHAGWKSDPKATPAGMLENSPNIGTDRSTIPTRLKEKGLKMDRGDLLWLDDNVGAVVKKLEEKGVLDNTIIVYVSDHGVESGKTTAYQGGMKTEGFIWSKNIEGGKMDFSLSSSVDFVPTLMDMIGGDVSKYPYDGVSLKPILTGEKDKVRETVYGEVGNSRAVIKGKYKYIALRYSDYTKNMPISERKAWLGAMTTYMHAIGRLPFDNDPMGNFGHSGQIPGGWDNEWKAMKKFPAYFEPDQLYDLENDPDEQVNLANKEEYKAVLADMKKELQVYIDDLPGGFAEFKRDEFENLSQDSVFSRAEHLRQDVFH